MVSTYAPTRCGIARFAESLIEGVWTADPSMQVDVVRLLPECGPDVSQPPVVMEVDPNLQVGMRAAARLINRYDVAVLQHEFGIYGEDDGSSVVDLIAAIDVPCIVVLHTVLPDPSPQQRSIIRSLADEGMLVVLCSSAADLLESHYGISPEAVEVIPHGTTWSPQPVNPAPRRELITWGLLGPGKGIERALAALASITDIEPAVRYRIVGRTHPMEVARSGDSYRSKLQRLVFEYGIHDRVEFIDRYVDESQLFELVRSSDLVVVPYDNHDQVSSGVIAEATGIGRPVVATRFPHSIEAAASGAVIAVEHDPLALADAIRELLMDQDSYDSAAEAAKANGRHTSWPNVATRYTDLIRGVASARATA